MAKMKVIADRALVHRDRGKETLACHRVPGGLGLSPSVVGDLTTADPSVPLALLASGDAGPPGWPIRAILSAFASLTWTAPI